MPTVLAWIRAHFPAMTPEEIRQIGLLSVDPGERRFLREQGIEVFDMR